MHLQSKGSILMARPYSSPIPRTDSEQPRAFSGGETKYTDTQAASLCTLVNIV